ncbi:MAG: sulfite exporter TauE/SafE family protein [Anaerolineaceae bacterium]
MGFWQFMLIGIGAFFAGGVNALAGGGTLITFPLLTAVGLPAVVANITNTVALSPGYFGATLAQWKEIAIQKKRLWLYIPAAIFGGVTGGLILLRTSEQVFRGLVPFLILAASLLLALGDPLRNWLNRRHPTLQSSWELIIISVLAVAAAAIYGGYFGAGLSVIFLAVLGVFINESLTQLNALKQVLALATNLSAAIFFVFSGKVDWGVTAVMAVFALGGGALGGRLAGKINPEVLRWLVVGIGLVVAALYFVKNL